MAAGYNEIIEELKDAPDLEALVLLHEDTEITDPAFCTKIRDALADRSVGLIGVVGARNVDHLAYWLGELRGFVEETRGVVDGGRGFHDVDAVDGLLMVLAPWSVRNVHFDDVIFSGFHGYDVDYSFAVRNSGKRVVTEDLAVYHHTDGGYGDVSRFLQASRSFRRKWLRDAPMSARAVAWRRDARICRQRMMLRILRSSWRTP